jgi:branched-chain amino acid transport system permease protein
VLLGAPTLRLRGDYLAIVTLGFGEIIRIFLNNLNAPINITNGPQGVNLIDPIKIGGVSLAQTHTVFELSFPAVYNYYYLFLVLALAVIFVSIRLENSRIGRAWVAIREDEVAAEAMGIDTARYKLYAFLLSAFVPGVVGGLFARDLGYIEPVAVFPLAFTITMIVMALFGGKGTVWGPVLGAAALFVFQELVWARFLYLHQILFGAIIILVVLFVPRGILGVLQQRYRLPRYV